jgi:aromatic-L-amino-acid decarboxylase
MCPRQLSVVCFRFVPSGSALSEVELDELNLALVEALQKTGRAFLSSTRLNGRVALRFCFVNWRTTAADVEEAVTLLADLGKRVSEASTWA